MASTITIRAVPRKIRQTTLRVDCGNGISFQPRMTYAATQPARTSACTKNHSLSLPPALTFSERFSPVARCNSLRISGLREISSAVSAIIIKIAFGQKMGATRLRREATAVWKPLKLQAESILKCAVEYGYCRAACAGGGVAEWHSLTGVSTSCAQR